MKLMYLILILIVLVISLGFLSYVSTIEQPNKTGNAYLILEIDERLLPKDEPIVNMFEDIHDLEVSDDEEVVLNIFPKDQKAYIQIKDLKFIPNELTVPVGTTVIWENNDWLGMNGRAHMIVHPYNEFRSKRLNYNQKFNHTFREPGVYTYIDPIYKSSANGLVMKKGKIIVE